MPVGQYCRVLTVMGMLLWSMLSWSPHTGVHASWSILSSPHSDGDATLVNAVFKYSQWCVCPLVNAVLSSHIDGDATLVNAVFEYSRWCACPLVNAVLGPHCDGDATLVNVVFESSQ